MLPTRTNLNIVVLALPLIIIPFVFTAKPPIPCSLRWTLQPNTGILPDTIPVHTNELFVAKISRNGAHIIGNVNNITMASYFEDSEDGRCSLRLLQ